MQHGKSYLKYPGVDAAWEQRELSAFTRSTARTHAEVLNYLLGRLLEEDLHVSCKPMLPPNMHEMDKSMLQGVCLLQIVDIVNIGANFESRTEETKGPTRTLKLCLTDGHETVYGFEFEWLPALNVKTPRGTKVLIQNVAVRRGLLLLTPATCQVLGPSDNDALEAARTHIAAPSAPTVPAGAYSAALITAGSDFSTVKVTRSETTKAPPPRATTVSMRPDPRPALPITSGPLNRPVQSSTTPAPPNPTYNGNVNCPSNLSDLPIQRRLEPESVQLPVFVDVSSDDDCASDVTDPMVEHLFYSPNTPRLRNQVAIKRSPSRKRPHPESNRAASRTDASRQPAAVVDMTSSPMETDQLGFSPSFSLLPTAPPISAAPPRDHKAPFLYLDAKAKRYSHHSLQVGAILTIRGFMKSVSGFQFNTGMYKLRVQIEDGTATREVQVDPPLVQTLMGVPCAQFAQAMQRTPPVAHKLAAKMQVRLMTMQGIMRLRLDALPDKLTLLECRKYLPDETRALLARVRHQTQSRNR